jgi:hypothetical protein
MRRKLGIDAAEHPMMLVEMRAGLISLDFRVNSAPGRDLRVWGSRSSAELLRKTLFSGF